MYPSGYEESVSAYTTSTIANHHSPLCIVRLIFWPLKIAILFSIALEAAKRLPTGNALNTLFGVEIFEGLFNCQHSKTKPRTTFLIVKVTPYYIVTTS